MPNAEMSKTKAKNQTKTDRMSKREVIHLHRQNKTHILRT
jgi:hypothetical protein